MSSASCQEAGRQGVSEGPSPSPARSRQDARTSGRSLIAGVVGTPSVNHGRFDRVVKEEARNYQPGNALGPGSKGDGSAITALGSQWTPAAPFLAAGTYVRGP
jgi:hypothetical protein